MHRSLRSTAPLGLLTIALLLAVGCTPAEAGEEIGDETGQAVIDGDQGRPRQTCQTAYAVQVSGDHGPWGFDGWRYIGSGSTWFSVKVTENSGDWATRGVKFRTSLYAKDDPEADPWADRRTPAASYDLASNYDLYVFDGCPAAGGKVVARSTQASGRSEQVSLEWGSWYPRDDGKTLFVEVRLVSGASAQGKEWLLRIDGGHVPGPG
jgi:hypothetical protein